MPFDKRGHAGKHYLLAGERVSDDVEAVEFLGRQFRISCHGRSLARRIHFVPITDAPHGNIAVATATGRHPSTATRASLSLDGVRPRSSPAKTDIAPRH
jgi:hypothetical protein